MLAFADDPGDDEFLGICFDCKLPIYRSTPLLPLRAIRPDAATDLSGLWVHDNGRCRDVVESYVTRFPSIERYLTLGSRRPLAGGVK